MCKTKKGSFRDRKHHLLWHRSGELKRKKALIRVLDSISSTVLDMRGSNPLSRSMKNKCKCGNEIHPVRIKYGYNNCVACSTVEKYGCAPIINHKTGNSIQVLSRADAERIAKLTKRKGYGTMLR